MLQLQHKNSGKGPLWLVNAKYIVGCHESCDVKLPKISATLEYAELLVNANELEIVNISDDEAPKVNGVAVRSKQKLVAGDVITIGDDELLIIDPKNAKRAASDQVAEQQGPAVTSLWAFKALNTALADKQFPLKDSQVLGRSNECDITLGVVHLSRKHASVAVTDLGLLIEDLDSANGTFINAKKITRATAVAGDEVMFDTLKFQVIGPLIDSNKTTVRASVDGDLTTVRPALNLANKAASKPLNASPERRAEAPKQAAKTAAKRPSPAPQTQTSPSGQADEGKKSSALTYGVLLAVVLVGALATWAILGSS